MTYTYHGIMDADYNWTEYVSLEHVCDSTSYCTQRNDMDPSQNVHVDVLSSYIWYWMFYYTLHSNTDVSQYAHADVPSEQPGH